MIREFERDEERARRNGKVNIIFIMILLPALFLPAMLVFNHFLIKDTSFIMITGGSLVFFEVLTIIIFYFSRNNKRNKKAVVTESDITLVYYGKIPFTNIKEMIVKYNQDNVLFAINLVLIKNRMTFISGYHEMEELLTLIRNNIGVGVKIIERTDRYYFDKPLVNTCIAFVKAIMFLLLFYVSLLVIVGILVIILIKFHVIENQPVFMTSVIGMVIIMAVVMKWISKYVRRFW